MLKDDFRKIFDLIFFIILFWAISGSRLGLFVFFFYLFYNILKLLINKYKYMPNNVIDVAGNATKRVFFSIIIITFLIWLLSASIVIVDAGMTGVYTLFGKVRDTELRSGFHIVNPFAKIIPMSIRTEEYTMSITQGEGRKVGADSIAALTKEGLNVDLDITVLYHLDEQSASDIYRELGIDYEEKIIRPTIRSVIREIIAQYDAKDIYSEKRQEAAQKILARLKEEIEPRGITVEEVLLRNVALPVSLTKAIQDKLKAEQEAQKYDYLLEKEKKEKQRKIIEAEGQRDAQKIINESLTTNYLYYLYIKELKDRQGTIYVPTNPSTGMPLFRDLGR